ncbi:MAG: hypothetical protein RR971_03105 [Alistipes sp.]
MKKLILMAAAVLLLAAPAAQAQKVNKEAILSKLEKSDSEIADAKKNAKVSTWLNRGKTYFEAAAEPTKNLFGGMELAVLKLAIGDVISMEQTKIGDKSFDVAVYPYFRAYITDGKVVAWLQTVVVKPNLIEDAIAAYNKAYELDPKSADKVKTGLKQICDFCTQIGFASFDLLNYEIAADGFTLAYQAQECPAYGAPNVELLYNAGFMDTLNGTIDPASFVAGEKCLNKAIEMGYEGEEGNAYYYLFHCYYGQRDKDPENLQKAKQALETGIAKFPKSQRILDGLMSLYTAEKGVGDPADLIARIEAAVADEPTNVDLWFGRGRVYAALKNNDECIVSFKKVAELTPDNFDGYFYTGYFYVEKGDAMNAVLNEKPWTGEAAYTAEQKTINAVYAAAIPWFEKALALKENDRTTVDYLKSICYRLRDEEGVMEKYTKYNEQFKALQQ